MFVVVKVVIEPSVGLGICVVENEIDWSGSFLGY